jgi:CRP/FNR family cyclic AMP-dependent transcriptional regulator
MLANVDLFSGLSEEALTALARLTVKRRLPRNTVLFLQGDVSDSFYIVESGKVKVFVDDEAGNQVILNILAAGDTFGELALLDDEPRSASVMTLTDVMLIAISRAHFIPFLVDNPDIGAAMMRTLAKRIRSLTDSVRDLALLDVYGRVARLLERLAGGEDQAIRPRLTHQEIASMVGSSREMVSRVMKELTVGGYVEQTPDALLLRKRLPLGW